MFLNVFRNLAVTVRCFLLLEGLLGATWPMMNEPQIVLVLLFFLSQLYEKVLLVPSNTFWLDAAIHSRSIKFSCLCICSMQVFAAPWLTEIDGASLIPGPAAVEL